MYNTNRQTHQTNRQNRKWIHIQRWTALNTKQIDSKMSSLHFECMHFVSFCEMSSWAYKAGKILRLMDSHEHEHTLTGVEGKKRCKVIKKLCLFQIISFFLFTFCLSFHEPSSLWLVIWITYWHHLDFYVGSGHFSKKIWELQTNFTGCCWIEIDASNLFQSKTLAMSWRIVFE